MLPLEPTALTPVGALGLPRPAAAMLAATPVPLRLRARSVKDTVSPFVKPETTSEASETNVGLPAPLRHVCRNRRAARIARGAPCQRNNAIAFRRLQVCGRGGRCRRRRNNRSGSRAAANAVNGEILLPLWHRHCVSPVNVARLVAAVNVPPVYSTMYAVIAAPPLSLGAVHCKVITPLPSCACKPVGAAGVVAAVAITGAEAAPRPPRLTANTFAKMLWAFAIG